MVERIERIRALYRAAGQQSRNTGMDTYRAAGQMEPQDTVTLDTDWQQTDWTRAVNEVLESLRDSFPGIEIATGSAQDGDELKRLAIGLGGGKHLVIDQAFLDKMAQGPEEFQEGCDTLLRLLRTLSATDITGVYVGEEKAQTWTYFEKSPAAEQMVKARQLLHWFAEMNKPKKEKKTIFVTNPRNYSTKGKYHRLSRAASVGQVNLLISDINSAINNLQGEAMSSSENAAQARRAIRSLRTLLQRATRKISRLQAEQLLSAKKKRAEREQKQEEANRLRRAQKEQRTKRKRADAAAANGGIVQTPVQNKRWKHGYDEFAAAAVPACPLPSVSAGDMGGAGDAAGGAVELGPEIAL